MSEIIRSLEGVKDPIFTLLSSLNNWLIIVGITALFDCLGPYVLKLCYFNVKIKT